MSALELFKVLGDEKDRPPSPPKHILKKKKPSQSEKVKRYWPGKVPDYVGDEESYSEESSPEEEPQVVAEAEPDRRLTRYNITQVEVSKDVSERIRKRRAQVETITVYQSENSKDLEKHQDGYISPKNEDRSTSEKVEPCQTEKKLDRNTLRRLALEYRKKEEESLTNKVEEEDVLEEEYEESESPEDQEEQEDEDDEEEELNVLSKPIFVPKGSRKTDKEKEELAREEIRRKENEKKRLEERKKDTKEMVIKKFQEDDDEPEEEEELIDDTDTLDEKEYELWKIRELKRILRDKEDREKFKKLEEEVQMRRNMTDEERELDNQKVDKVVVEKGKLHFLQKYYHKGAFFMDKLQDKSEPLYARDFNAPTADDLIDKSVLPKPMRVRRGQFGKQGRVKHTHLKDVDTTQFDAWSSSDKFKLTGTKQVFDRPSKKK